MVERGGKTGGRPAPSVGQVSVSPQGFPSEKNCFRARQARLRPAVHRATIYLRRKGLAPRETQRKAYGHVRAGMPAGRWSAAPTSGMVGLVPSGNSFHDSPNRAERDRAHRARGPYVPRHHLGGLGHQLADHEISAERIAAADGARPDRRDRRGPAGAARCGARPKPARAARPVAAADAGRRCSTSRRLDGADGAGAALAAGQRGRADRLHHAGMGLAAGLAGARRADVAGANAGAADGVRGHRRADGRQRHLPPAWKSCRAS